MTGYTVFTGPGFRGRSGHDGEPPLPYVKLTLDLVPRPWLIPDRIPSRNVTLLSGEGSIGKSVLVLQLLGATVLDEGRWLGYPIARHGPSLYITAEEEDDEVRRRLECVAASLFTTRSKMESAGLEVLSFAGRDCVLAGPDRDKIIRPTRLFERIRADALKLKPKLIALDAAADVFAGDEINRTQTRQFITLLRGLAIDTDGAIILVAHPSLQGISRGTGLSGSTAWHNSVRARMYFKKADGVDDESLRALEVKKQNYGPVTETLLLRWRNGVYALDGVGEGEEQAERVLERAAEESKIEQLFLTLLRRYAKQNRNVSDNVSPTYAPAKFAEEPEAKRAKVSKEALAEAMARLFARDKLAAVPFGSPSRSRSKIVEVEGTPTYSAAPSNVPSDDLPTGLPTLPTGCTHTPPIPPSTSEGGQVVGSPPPSDVGRQGGAQGPFKTYSHLWRSRDYDYPCTPTGVERRGEEDGRIYARVRTPDGTENFVPKDELVPAEGGNGTAGGEDDEPPPAGDAADPKEPRQPDDQLEPPPEPLMSWEADDLRARGFSRDELEYMNPKRAREIIADPTRNRLTERYGKGGGAPPETICRKCGQPGARYFSDPDPMAGMRAEGTTGPWPLHLRCCEKFFKSGGLTLQDDDL